MGPMTIRSYAKCHSACNGLGHRLDSNQFNQSDTTKYGSLQDIMIGIRRHISNNTNNIYHTTIEQLIWSTQPMLSRSCLVVCLLYICVRVCVCVSLSCPVSPAVFGVASELREQRMVSMFNWMYASPRPKSNRRISIHWARYACDKYSCIRVEKRLLRSLVSNAVPMRLFTNGSSVTKCMSRWDPG
jgi:hypothetical protein